MKKLTFIFLVAFAFIACGAPALKAGDAVLIDWAGDDYSWNKAKLVAECGEAEAAGWSVDFTDDFYDVDEGGDPECYPLARIMRDAVPSEGDVKVGDRVLGEWVESYYHAEVKEIKDGKYSVKYDDDIEDDLELAKLRVLPVKK